MAYCPLAKMRVLEIQIMNKKNKSKKGEKMSLRKFVSLLLLVAFALTSVPAQAAILQTSATLPTLVQETGTVASGANVDIVPVTIQVNDIGTGNLNLTRMDFNGGIDDNATVLTINPNGTFNATPAIGANGVVLGGTTPRAFIVTPPAGTKFVGLPHAGYAVNGVTLAPGGALVKKNVAGILNNNILPGAGANGNAAIARVLTEAHPVGLFGPGVTVRVGSIIAYFATAHGTDSLNTAPTNFTLANFGLAVNPKGAANADAIALGNISATYVRATGDDTGSALSPGALADGATLAIAQVGATAPKLEFGMSTTEDAQPNSVLGVLLSSAGNGVTISPAEITSTAAGASLKVDTDALFIRAREVSTGVFFQTPFATSAFNNVVNENGGVAILNTALTNDTRFPNTANALITVEFAAVNPVTNTAYAASDAAITVNNVSVTLAGEKIDSGIRANITKNGGFLGAVIRPLVDNADVAITNQFRAAVAAIYNGTSATSRLVARDATPVDYSAPTNAVGFVAATALTVEPNLYTQGTGRTTAVSPFVDGIFSKSFVSRSGANAAQGRNSVQVNNVNGTAAAGTFKLDFADAVPGAGDFLYTPSEVTVRLSGAAAANGSNAWFIVTGNTAGNNLTAVGATVVGPTNSATSAGPVLKKNAAASAGVKDNAIAVARLSGTTLQILPLQNFIDGSRHVILVRPEIGLKVLSQTARANGVRVTAAASGNNLAATTVTVATVIGTGTLDADAIVKAVPLNGAMNRLMVHNGGTQFAGRANTAALTTIDGSATTVDNFMDLVANGKALDENLPSLFCGGTIGAGKKGPNAVINQAKPIGILISENGQTNAFETVANNNDTAIRVTLPTGWDINKYTAAQGDLLAAFSTGGFGFAPAVADFEIQGVRTGAGVSQAYVDIRGFTLNTTNDMDRAIVLGFQRDALVAPANVSDFTATVSIVYTNGTVTTADDTVLATLGTVQLGTACGAGLMMSFCDSALSSVGNGFGPIESNMIANGANLTSFSGAPTGALRIVQSNVTAETIRLPDICINEGSSDLFAVGPDNEGGRAAAGRIYIFPSFTNDATDSLHFNTAAPRLSIMDNSVTLTSSFPADLGGDVGDMFRIDVTAAANSVRPDQVSSEIRVTGLLVEGPNDTIYPTQSLVAGFFDPTSSAMVGSVFPLQYFEDTVNGNFISNRATGADDDADKMAAHFYNADVLDNTALVLTDFGADDDHLSFVFQNTTAPVLASAVTTQLDNDAFKRLDDAMKPQISVAVFDITDSASKKVEISAQPGLLQPKSTIEVTLSGVGSNDTVTVPVLADGSFKATLTADTTQTIILRQRPSSGRTDVAPQIIELDVADANVEPKLLSATVKDIGLGTVPSRGRVPVVIKVTATGKKDGQPYTPVASELTVSGQPVTAVAGKTDEFIAVVRTAQPIIVRSSAGAGSQVTATGLNPTATTRRGIPQLAGRIANDKQGRIVFRGNRINRPDGRFVILNNNGTLTDVTLRSATRGDRQNKRRKSEAAVTIPSTAVYAIFISPSAGVNTRPIN
jgi:hypothetical protein